MTKSTSKKTREDVTTTEATVKEETVKEETAIERNLILSPVLADLAAGNPNPMFLANHGERLKSIARPTPQDLLEILAKMPDDLKEQVTDLIKKMSPNRPGLYLSEERPTFTELRLFQGSGDDKNRPENAAVGQFYLTTKVNVGKEFIGTVIALWQGRTMWPSQEDEVRAPICTSMDRRVGSKYGDCSTCPHRPWKDGQKQACGNDIVTFMLPKTLDDIVMVRFQRTSTRTGEQLANYVKKDLVPWQRWFRLTTEKQTAGDRRWYVMNVDPVEDQGVPIDLTVFCAALEKMASHDFIIPGLGRIYRTAAESQENMGNDDGGDGGSSSSGDDDYGDFGA